jgi:hypothetical protein
MARRHGGLTFDDVRRIAAELPGVEEGTAWGVPALKLRGRFLACMASHKSAEPGTLVVRLAFDQRDAIITDAPETYYLKPHYAGYESVLVRLSRIDREALRDLLNAACRFVDRSSRKGQSGVASAPSHSRERARPQSVRSGTGPTARGPRPRRSR